MPADLQTFRAVVSVHPLGNGKHFDSITQVAAGHIIKARLFCGYLRGSSLRVLYHYAEQEQKIELIALYAKDDKENEDKKRIREYLRSRQY